MRGEGSGSVPSVFLLPLVLVMENFPGMMENRRQNKKMYILPLGEQLERLEDRGRSSALAERCTVAAV